LRPRTGCGALWDIGLDADVPWVILRAGQDTSSVMNSEDCKDYRDQFSVDQFFSASVLEFFGYPWQF
jgi:hypothetical protein